MSDQHGEKSACLVPRLWSPPLPMSHSIPRSPEHRSGPALDSTFLQNAVNFSGLECYRLGGTESV